MQFYPSPNLTFGFKIREFCLGRDSQLIWEVVITLKNAKKIRLAVAFHLSFNYKEMEKNKQSLIDD